MICAQIRHGLGGFSLDIAFEVPERGITGLYGPSGAGKTSILRVLCGLLRAEDAVVRVGDCVWHDTGAGTFVAPHKRGVGYVAQGGGLFPHLSVHGNLEFGLRRTPAAERRVSWEDAVSWMGLQGLLERSTADLSGGERQRVAIARALLAGPQLLLLDEPVSALDEARRDEVLPYLARLHREAGIPILLVTHSLAEIARFADHIVHVTSGKVVGSGTLTDMLPRLGTARDAVAVLNGTVRSMDTAHHLIAVETAFGSVWATSGGGFGEGAAVRLMVAAREVTLSLSRAEGTSVLNQLPARVLDVRDVGAGQLLVSLAALNGTEELLALVTLRSREALRLEEGTPVFAQVKGVNVFPCA